MRTEIDKNKSYDLRKCEALERIADSLEKLVSCVYEDQLYVYASTKEKTK